MFSDFKFLLNRSVRRSGASSYVDERNIVSYFSDCLTEVFGEKTEDNIQIIEFRQGAINVACLRDGDAVYLKEKENYLIDKINEKLDKTLVSEIRVLT